MSSGLASEDDLRREVVRYISEALDIDELLLTGEFDVSQYISRNWERETVNVSKDDYIFFWKHFVTHFGVYDEILDFEIYAKKKKYGCIQRLIMRPLFRIGFIGNSGVWDEAKVKDFVAMARNKTVPPETRRTIHES